MGNVAHDGIAAPAFDESPQLGLDIFRLLSGKPRHREISEIALALQAMTGLAIFELGLEASSRSHSFLRVSACGKRHRQNGRQQQQGRAAHDGPAVSPAA